MNESDLPRNSRDKPTLEDHPGLDNDEATEAGKMMTASGSLGPDVEVDDDAEKPEESADERRQ